MVLPPPLATRSDGIRLPYEGILAHRKKTRRKHAPVEVLVRWSGTKPTWQLLSKLESEAYWPLLHYMERHQLQNVTGWKHLNKRGWEAKVYATAREEFPAIAEMQEREIAYELIVDLASLS